MPLSQLAIAWCASNPNVSSVITGATKESQVNWICLVGLTLQVQWVDHFFIYCILFLSFFSFAFSLGLNYQMTCFYSWVELVCSLVICTLCVTQKINMAGLS